jgi:hypothetical protein
MTNCREPKLSEHDAKNKAVHVTRSLRHKRPKTGSSLGQAKAYYCKECNAWHVKREEPKEVLIREPDKCQELYSIPN